MLGRCGGSFSAFFSSKTSAYSAYSRGTQVGTLEIALTWASAVEESRAALTAALSSVTSMTENTRSWSCFRSTCLVGRMAGRRRRRREELEGENFAGGSGDVGGQGSVPTIDKGKTSKI